MDFTIIKYDCVEKELWDSWVSKIKESTYLHSSMFLDFLHTIMDEQNIHTFACVINNDTPLALCPLGISTVKFHDIEFIEGSWNGAPLGVPAISEMTPSRRTTTQTEVLGIIHSILKEKSAQRNYIRRHPVNNRVLSGVLDSGELSVMQHGYGCLPQNTVVMDLKLSEDDLVLQLSKYQRKHIKHSKRDGLEVKVCGPKSENLDRIFREYQEAHIKSAGKITRPQKSFDMMRELVRKSHATMFIACLGDKPLSYLYCGEFADFAFGWSQVNLDEYEKEFSPRQYLEWSAILNYKQRGFKFYEVGTLWYGHQFYMLPTQKELSIAEFKRRYGGILLPELCFEKYFDQKLWNRVFEKRKELFNNSGYFPSNTGQGESDHYKKII